MSFSIGSSSSSLRFLSQATQNVNDFATKLFSGKRINKASDDAAGLAIAAQLASASTVLDQGSQNIDYSQLAINVGDSVLSSSTDISNRLSELATQSANGTYSDAQRSTIDTEFNQLKQELSRQAQSADFNGINPVGGQGIDTQVGTSSDPNNRITVPGVDANQLASSLSGLSISTASGASSALSAISSYRDSVSVQRGVIGAVSSRLDVAKENNQVASDNSRGAASRIEDVDVAEAASRFTQYQINQQSAVNSLKQINQAAPNVLRLLA